MFGLLPPESVTRKPKRCDGCGTSVLHPTFITGSRAFCTGRCHTSFTASRAKEALRGFNLWDDPDKLLFQAQMILYHWCQVAQVGFDRLYPYEQALYEQVVEASPTLKQLSEETRRKTWTSTADALIEVIEILEFREDVITPAATGW